MCMMNGGRAELLKWEKVVKGCNVRDGAMLVGGDE